MQLGATMPNLNQRILASVPVVLPPREHQERIIGVISAYDDLIENNRRRIQLLEQAARLLYKEWFVYLRFPGYEDVKIKDGVPEGWERNNALDVMDVMSGGTPKVSVSSYWDGEIPFFTSKDTTDYAYVFRTERALTEEGLKNCNSELYLLWSDETGLPAADYSAAEVETKTDDVFRHVFRVYPTVPSPYCEKAA
jgi:type I restriction enzyme S subunit